MKKIYVRYKILVNGFSPLGEYRIDEFLLKTGKIDEKKFSNELHNISEDEMMYINLNPYIAFCLCDKRNLLYRYFENDELIEFVLPKKEKMNASDILNKYPSILEKAQDLEAKLRIIFNIPILFQSICIQFYDENKKFICNGQVNKQISTWNRLTYSINPNEFSNNSRFEFDYNSMKNTKNNYFNRALKLFNNSFDSEKIEVRYILLFSCLEAIFNLDTRNITDKLSRISAKLLAEENPDKLNIISKEIKNLYRKRSNYVHGSKLCNIVEEDEKNLRRYVRKIIIAYWLIIIYTKKTAKQILQYLDNKEKIDIKVRAMIIALNSDNFYDQQQNLINLFENELNIKIPDDIKSNILGKFEKNNK